MRASRVMNPRKLIAPVGMSVPKRKFHTKLLGSAKGRGGLVSVGQKRTRVVYALVLKTSSQARESYPIGIVMWNSVRLISATLDLLLTSLSWL